MDAKITKKRLSRMLSYDWIKIILLAAILIVVWVLVFTMTATRITPAQQFTVYNYMNNATFMETGFDKFLSDAYSKGVFSYEILDDPTTLDLAANTEYAGTLLETRIATYEGDVILVADAGNPALGYEEDEETGEKIYNYSYAETFAMNYRYTLFDLDLENANGYFRQMENFLQSYYGTDWREGELKMDVVEKKFRARVDGDKRYKKEAQIKAGIVDEKDRIEDYRAALIRFYELLDKGYVSLVPVSIETEDGMIEGTYFINICPTEATAGLADIMGYYGEYYDEETGEKKTSLTAKDMCVGFLNIFGDDYDLDEGFQYEDLVFTVYMVDTYLDESKAP